MSSNSLPTKINDIRTVSTDLDYLREEYYRNEISANRDGAVTFERLCEWIASDETGMVDHIVKTVKKLQDI